MLSNQLWRRHPYKQTLRNTRNFLQRVYTAHNAICRTVYSSSMKLFFFNFYCKEVKLFQLLPYLPPDTSENFCPLSPWKPCRHLYRSVWISLIQTVTDRYGIQCFLYSTWSYVMSRHCLDHNLMLGKWIQRPAIPFLLQLIIVCNIPGEL